MRILHVVTVADPEMSFGGPLRVALNLCRHVAAQGHSVVLAAGATGWAPAAPPRRIEGVRAELVPVRQVLPRAGFSGLTGIRLLARLARLIRAADIVHVHASRDLVTLPAAVLALRYGKPLALQCHGMIDPSGRRAARPLDALLTRRVLARAGVVFSLTGLEERALRAVARQDLPQLRRLRNGVPVHDRPPVARRDDLVVFAARLQERKRPEAFVELAARVLTVLPGTQFLLAGPDEGCAAAVRRRIVELGLTDSVRCVGPLEHPALLRQLAEAAVYVLPAVDEPFAMTVLESMSVGTPVVITDSCGLADHVRAAGAGLVTSPGVDSLADGVISLLEDPPLRASSGRAGRDSARTTFDLDAVGGSLEDAYRELLASHGRSDHGEK